MFGSIVLGKKDLIFFLIDYRIGIAFNLTVV